MTWDLVKHLAFVLMSDQITLLKYEEHVLLVSKTVSVNLKSKPCFTRHQLWHTVTVTNSMVCYDCQLWTLFVLFVSTVLGVVYICLLLLQSWTNFCTRRLFCINAFVNIQDRVPCVTRAFPHSCISSRCIGVTEASAKRRNIKCSNWDNDNSTLHKKTLTGPPGCSFVIGVSRISEVPWQSIENAKVWRWRKLPRFLCMSVTMLSADVANNWYAKCQSKTIQRSYSLTSGLYMPDPQRRHIFTWTG